RLDRASPVSTRRQDDRWDRIPRPGGYRRRGRVAGRPQECTPNVPRLRLSPFTHVLSERVVRQGVARLPATSGKLSTKPAPRAREAVADAAGPLGAELQGSLSPG